VPTPDRQEPIRRALAKDFLVQAPSPHRLLTLLHNNSLRSGASIGRRSLLSSQIFEDDPMIRTALYRMGLVALLMTAAWQPAGAASFDCSKAENADKKAVCADRQLNDEDVEMAVLYTQLKPLLGMGARGDTEDEQGVRLKRRAACGADRACLSNAYQERIQQLRGGFEALAKRGPS
jgi:hypothetical protein